MITRNIPNIIAATYNMCEIHETWADNVTSVLPQPDRPVHSAAASGPASIREALVYYFNS